MMCLGWHNRATCKARPEFNISQPGQEVAGNGTACPSTSWFWLLAAGIVGAGFFKKA